MHAPLNSSRRSRQGYALLFTLIFLATVLMVFGGMFHWVGTNARIIQRNNQYVASQAAAEAGTERVLASIMADFLNQAMTTTVAYASMQISQTNYDGTPWPVRYVYSDLSGATGRISVVSGPVQAELEPINSQYANLRGYPCYWTNTATATPIGQPFTVPATVSQVINLSTIPAFQYAIFYNLNLEIDPGVTMNINGPVWSNAGIWGGTGNLTFNSQVSAVNTVSTASTDPYCTGKTDSSAPPHFTMAGQPTASNTRITIPIAGTTNTAATNITAWLNIPPDPYSMGTANAYTTNGLSYYLANNSDLIVSNSFAGTNYGAATPYGTNITIWFQNSYNSGSYLTKLPQDFYILKIPAKTGLYTNFISSNWSDTNRCYTNVYYAGWSFATNVAFYDYREGDTVQAVQIDVAKFNTWLTNSSFPNGGSNTCNNRCNGDKNRQIDSMWIYNGVIRTASTLPAVRMVNGIQLSPQGLNIVTPMPIYVKGDYNKQRDSSHVSSGTNTANTYPACLMGDAITILSANWSDDNNSGTSLGSRNAVATTVNAACLEGIVESVTPNYYSGGVENFLRFLETWGNSNTNTYNGSIVVMFPSVYATNRWIAPGTYYQAPARSWGFDYNFTDPNKLPRLTPKIKKLVRYTWQSK